MKYTRSINCKAITDSRFFFPLKDTVFFSFFLFFFKCINKMQLHKKQRCFDKQVYAFIPF